MVWTSFEHFDVITSDYKPTPTKSPPFLAHLPENKKNTSGYTPPAPNISLPLAWSVKKVDQIQKIF